MGPALVTPIESDMGITSNWEALAYQPQGNSKPMLAPEQSFCGCRDREPGPPDLDLFLIIEFQTRTFCLFLFLQANRLWPRVKVPGLIVKTDVASAQQESLAADVGSISYTNTICA